MKRRLDNPYVAAGFGREFPWLDLANSLEWNGFGKLTDHLLEPAWLAHMLKHWNLTAPVPQPRPMEKILELRALLRQLGEKLVSGKAMDNADLAALNAYLKVPAHLKLIQRQNGVGTELVPINADWPWILSRIAASFAEMLAQGHIDRLKFCPNQGCRWVFYDQTKGNTRRWCNDRTCGNRDRVRRARAKKKPPRRRPKS
jgi:predicted RNA-binding Zn ribbon-like protein